mmetsp:Transcript_12909/g.35173  ORF Transcript_12909/g.35173 Transcript_12909/m.35173 type:complete len:201 (-) Transcript_12909:114-716(-)
MDHIESALVLLLVHDGAHAAAVVASGGHGQVAKVELHVLLDLASLNVQQHGVVDLDLWVRVADGAGVVGDNVWHTALAVFQTLDLAQLVGGLVPANAVDDEAALGVVDQAEVLVRLLELDDVHEASGVGGVGADLAIHLDQALLQDLHDLLVGEGVLETVPQHEQQWQALAQLVGPGGRLGGENTPKLVQHPVLRGIQPL